MYSILLNYRFLFFHIPQFSNHKDHLSYILPNKQNYQHLLCFIYIIQYNDQHQLKVLFFILLFYESKI